MDRLQDRRQMEARDSVEALGTWPGDPKSTVQAIEHEAIIAALHMTPPQNGVQAMR